MRLVENETDVILTEAEHSHMVLQIKDYEALKDKLEAKRLARRPYNRRYMRDYMRRRRAESVAVQV